MNITLTIPALSPQIEIYQIEPDKYMIHQTEFDKRILISKQLYDIIQHFEQHKHKNIHDSISEMGITSIEVEQIYFSLARYGIVAGNKKISKQNHADYLTFKTTLIPEKVVSLISTLFAPLFTYRIFIISTIIFSVFTIGLMINHLNFRSIYNQLNVVFLLQMQGIFMAGLIFHEFGHSSACKRYGANPGPIGFGFYLFTPVLYADVSDAWKLTKQQRIIVDLGGFYLQMLFCTILGVIYLLNGNPLLIPIIGLHLISMCVNLNPFFRYDGYWALSDGMSIYNLRPKALGKVNSLIRRIQKKEAFSITSSLDIFLFVYGLICYCFLFFFLFYLVLRNPQSVLYFPVNVYNFIENIIYKKPELGMIKTEFRRLLIPMAFYVIAIKYVIRNGHKIKRLFIKKITVL